MGGEGMKTIGRVFKTVYHWATWHDIGKRIEALEQANPVGIDINVLSGACYDFLGEDGKWHMRIDGQVEIVSPQRIPVVESATSPPAS